jgi:hypothetical protein
MYGTSSFPLLRRRPPLRAAIAVPYTIGPPVNQQAEEAVLPSAYVCANGCLIRLADLSETATFKKYM